MRGEVVEDIDKAE